ncbi:DMT family transporter [Stappia sp. F7233]|uniref:DMT family transporter n=1 Tax=Stappia albiluteola TaxID=2758565 RepID=A0A839ADH2_9HYPH|nr:DMT family transporter [Stappia albiluteola]MBA5777581.1 DMT family transporter [Stappia albiluteola]
MAGLTARANEDRPMLGIALMLFAYAVFSCIDTSAKWLVLAGIPAMQLSFMRYLGHFVLSLALIGRGGLNFRRFGTDQLFLVLLRALLLVASTVLNFIAVRYLPLTLTSTILFSAPILICALSGPLLGERVGIWRWSAIMVGFCGILVAIRPFDESFHWSVFLSLTGAFCFALYTLLTRKLAGIVASGTLQFYAGFVGTLVLAPLAFSVWQSPATGIEWTLMILLGVFGWFGHELLTRAHSFAAASTLTPFTYSFIIYLSLWSYAIFDHLPDRWTVAGAAIIVTAGLFIWFRERMLSRSRRAPRPAEAG